MIKTLTLAAATTAFAMTANAGTVDFSGLPVGTALTTFDFLDANTGETFGVTGSASAMGNNANSPDAAVIFNTMSDATTDLDLVSPFESAIGGGERGFGNAIIVQENAGQDGVFDPDDDGAGGTLTFAFDALMSFGDFYLLDAVRGASVTVYEAGNVVGSLATEISADTSNMAGPNLYAVLGFDGLVGDMFKVDFNGSSGALGEFEVNVEAVPLPATGLMLLAAVGGIGAMRRRKP